MRVVFNSDKSGIPGGSNGTPVDIFIDDMGTDGLNLTNPTPGSPSDNPDYERWAGYVNTSVSINDSSSSRWGALPGDSVRLIDRTSHLGANWSHSAQLFDGLIDWVSWKPFADYSGVDDSPK